MNNDYNPNTTPRWLSAMPTIMGIVAVLLVIAGLIVGAEYLRGAVDQLTELAGQSLCR